MAIEMRSVPWDHPGGAALREAQRVEVREVYYPELEESEPGPHPTADDIAVFYVAFDGDRAVGTGALRAIDDEHGEIKRMYVDPEYRGSGAAALIVHTLEDDARARGWNRLVLETGDTMLPAQRFYQRMGYEPIPLFGPYRWSDLSVCFGKSLEG
ncbi:MAG: family acetyltransferase [Schumannella sp.]|nr:family acetyltransferase [Schumannella sp.]